MGTLTPTFQVDWEPLEDVEVGESPAPRVRTERKAAQRLQGSQPAVPVTSSLPLLS